MKRLKRTVNKQSAGQYDPRPPNLAWLEPDSDNPFGIGVLDCRPITWNLVATTADPSVAESFASLRTSDGRDLIEAAIGGSVWIAASLTLPHDGSPLEGVVFKSDSMEVKWDIYLYDSTFLFARSWTGDLVYRAPAQIGPSAITIDRIECPASDPDIAPSHVYFLLGSHAMGRVLPHRVPADIGRDPTKVATWSFALFGKMASYAAFEDITGIPVDVPDS
jgi:hypothetical protein